MASHLVRDHQAQVFYPSKPLLVICNACPIVSAVVIFQDPIAADIDTPLFVFKTSSIRDGRWRVKIGKCPIESREHFEIRG